MSDIRYQISDMTSIRKYKKIFAAIPLMDELDNLPLLLRNLKDQHTACKVFVCVNQPDAWWDDEEKYTVCERNQESIEYLKKQTLLPVHVIDRSSKGKGWQGKNHGVGWARKLVMDAILPEADKDDIIITLDGDTTFNNNYFSSVLDNFNAHQDAVGLSVPYYHKLSGSEAEDRAILRYEIYMRSYVINLWRIGNPYHFTALGSAMAIPVSTYKAIGGMTPKKSGEDFYFLQKLIKYGRLMTWNEEKVYPAARFSDRVFFGTGPAMIKGAAGDWNSYPVYHHSLFDLVKETYDAFDSLFEKDIPTPLDDFIRNVLKQNNIWEPLRKNAKTLKQLKRACRDKVDGLRILQYLKYSQQERGYRDEDCLLEYFRSYQPGLVSDLDFLMGGFNFGDLSVEQLNLIRDTLVGIEEKYQNANHEA
ncbi:MAG: hypothetical protein ABFS05_11815 [Bacteroidota bacterium]